jgi:hypothetical protein
MPNFIADSISVTITDASASALTCADTTGLYVGQRGWAVDSEGENNLEVIVTQVLSGTEFLCQTIANIKNGGAADLTTYDGGSFYFDKQVIPVSGDGVPVLPTGASKTVDDVIHLLQILGICKQS